MKAVRGPVTAWVFSDGTARAVHREYLTFERSGKVEYIAPGPQGDPLRQGDPVRAGQLLARLDQRRIETEVQTAQSSLFESERQAEVAQADVEQARSQFQLSETQYNRVKQLVASRAVAQSELDEAKANYENSQSSLNAAQVRLKSQLASIDSAKAKLVQAKLGLEEVELVSPIDGVVAYMNIKQGNYFTQNVVKTSSESEALQTIPIVVISPDAYEVTVDIPSFEAQRVQVGQRVAIAAGTASATGAFNAANHIPPATSHDLSNTQQANAFAEGQVYSVNPAVNPGGRSVQVIVRTTSGAQLLRDGMFTSCWLMVEEKNDAIRIPYEALLFEENRPFVFQVQPSAESKTQATVHRQAIRLGVQGQDACEVLEGVDEGQVLATQGRYRLVDGAPVNTIGDTSDSRETADE